MDEQITKRDVIATVLFVAGACLFYKGVKGLVDNYRYEKKLKKMREAK